jgi:hypothetical protein
MGQLSKDLSDYGQAPDAGVKNAYGPLLDLILIQGYLLLTRPIHRFLGVLLGPKSRRSFGGIEARYVYRDSWIV